MNLGPLMSSDLSPFFQTTVGVGAPLTRHVRVTFNPSTTFVLSGDVAKLGASAVYIK